MSEALSELRQRLAEIHDLERALGVLGWDQRTMMPPRGAPARAEALATLGGIVHERFVDDETGRLLERLAPLEDSLDYDSDDASLIRVTRRDWEKARRVPSELAAAWLREGAKAQAAWLEARAGSDYGLFLPAFRRVHEIALRWAECFDPGDSPYDVFLDEYEPGMRTAEVKAVFDVLRPELTAIVAGAGEPADDSFLYGDFPVARQQEFLDEVLRRFGFEEGGWRLDPTVHPFATSFSRSDIRMTTRFKPGNLGALWAGMHEAGHGLTYQGADPALERTPLAGSASLGLGESQSRTWENLVGRSRPFWACFLPELQQLFPQLGSVGLDEFVRGVNRVEPGLIRVDADEVTYSLHIILRFELEQQLVDGSLFARGAAGGVERRDGRAARRGGAERRAGRAPGRALVASGLRLLSDLRAGERDLRPDLAARAGGAADLDGQIEAGEFGELYGWLRDRLYRHGRKFTPLETLERAIGESAIDPQPYLAYLREKVDSLRP